MSQVDVGWKSRNGNEVIRVLCRDLETSPYIMKNHTVAVVLRAPNGNIYLEHCEPDGTVYGILIDGSRSEFELFAPTT